MTGRQEYDRDMTGRQDDRQDDRQRILDEYMIDDRFAAIFPKSIWKVMDKKLFHECFVLHFIKAKENKGNI